MLGTNFYTIAVIGGDRRQVYLADILAKNGCEVIVYGLCERCRERKVKVVYSLEEALKHAGVIAAPVPFCKEGSISGSGKFPQLTQKNVLESAKAGSLFFAGGIPLVFQEKAETIQIRCIDYLKDETVAMKNTIAAAEGILAEAIRRSPRNLYQSSCLVLGYGKCGSTLVSYLNKFSCHVIVYEKESKAATQASIMGTRVIEKTELSRAIQEAQFIFNTVPSLVLSENMLNYVRKETVILDMASAPGGVDYEAANRMKINAALLPGLPGRYAPLSSAEILSEKILKELKERKC